MEGGQGRVYSGGSGQARGRIDAGTSRECPYSPRTGRNIVEAHRKMQEALGPGFRAAQEMMNSPGMRAAQEVARRYQENPALRAIEEFRNSPAMRAIEELQNNPTVRLMRELQDSPMMRAAREVEKVQRLINGGF